MPAPSPIYDGPHRGESMVLKKGARILKNRTALMPCVLCSLLAPAGAGGAAASTTSDALRPESSQQEPTAAGPANQQQPQQQHSKWGAFSAKPVLRHRFRRDPAVIAALKQAKAKACTLCTGAEWCVCMCALGWGDICMCMCKRAHVCVRLWLCVFV